MFFVTFPPLVRKANEGRKSEFNGDENIKSGLKTNFLSSLFNGLHDF
jgi:hypothetical protein